MAPPLHEAFSNHCVAYERVKDKSNVCLWHCKYCGRIQTSSVTRLLIHFCKLGGKCARCTEIPDNMYEECRRKYLPLKRRKGSFAENEVVSPDYVDSKRVNCPSISIGLDLVAPTMSSCEHDEVDVSKKAKGMGNSTSSRQPTLAQASGGVSGTITFLRERQRLAEIEIARTVIECNISFNVLRLDRQKCMVKAIANVGPCEGWYGVSYNDMRTKKLDEEKKRIDKSLEPMHADWVKYGYSILPNGWGDHKKRAIINILVSCPLGTYFLRAVEAEAKGKKVTSSFIYSHIRRAILEVGPQNVIQVVTDNASNCASMGRKLEEFPSIVWSPCASHCLDLLMEDIGNDILDSTPKRYDILYLVEKRWKWMKRPIHGVSALLHPTFKEASLFMDIILLEDRDTYLPKILSCKRHSIFLKEFIDYNDQRGIALASPIVWKRDSLVKPLFWWESFGYQMPLLQRIAMRDCSSGACERNWSAYSLIHTKIRNKLSTKQFERLIYCRSILRMLRTMHQMPMACQLNVDSLKLSLETLKSVRKEREAEEEPIFCDLYLELEEIDRRVNLTRSHSKVTIRASRNQQRRGYSTSTIAHLRRGSGSSSAPSAMEDENEAIKPREPSYDDDGNIISDGVYKMFLSCPIVKRIIVHLVMSSD
ncbi:hypothetical protein KP509_08G004800 [Ceratopteris richardii]|uniref:DUF659 domain-containing protein n=1 Tax=Ceratopteris richardii TaxID=49495 RepID=A0A8T2UBA6_CERRI|nr:hypothetical protein KP509_08G004800 [Ceratopteris richardii]